MAHRRALLLLSAVVVPLVVLEAVEFGVFAGLGLLQPWLGVCFAVLMLDLCGVLLYDWFRWLRFAKPGTAGRLTGSQDEPTEVLSPVVGRWRALNSPADRVPSRGTHRFGQTYAIGLTTDPAEERPDRAGRPGAAGEWWPVVRGNGDFPAFGAPVLACADATVVSVEDRSRDHTARSSYPALLLLLVERALRGVVGPSGLLGNYVVLRLDAVPRPAGPDPDVPVAPRVITFETPVYAVYAHLQRGSLAVREGDTVRAGQQLARCGNTGDSTEPHLHFQLMDAPQPERARGKPFAWRDVGVPAEGEPFSVSSL